MNYAQLEIEWVPYDRVEPNVYNPNVMSEIDRRLLFASILEDGWTQPLVAIRNPGEDIYDEKLGRIGGAPGSSAEAIIVDGEQRWTVSGMLLDSTKIQALLNDLLLEKDVGEEVSETLVNRLRLMYLWVKKREEDGILETRLVELTQNLVPVHFVDFMDEAHAILSTLRHNRARGVHAQALMVGIVSTLKDQYGMSYESFERRLGMTQTEVDRLVASLPVPQRLRFPGGERYSDSWTIEPVVKMPAAVREELGVQVTPAVKLISAASAAEEKRREEFVDAELAKVLAEKGFASVEEAPILTVISARQRILAGMPETHFTFLRRMIFALTPEQLEDVRPCLERTVSDPLTAETMPAAIVMLCNYIYDKSPAIREKVDRRVGTKAQPKSKAKGKKDTKAKTKAKKGSRAEA